MKIIRSNQPFQNKQGVILKNNIQEEGYLRELLICVSKIRF